MVNAEKHKAETKADDDVKPIKSTISVDIDNDSDVDYFALCGVYNHEIKSYVAANFKKEISLLTFKYNSGSSCLSTSCCLLINLLK